MSARRVTIGVKPAEAGPEPGISAEPVDARFDPDRGVKVLELLSARAAGTGERVGRSADAWIRRHDDPEPNSAALTIPTADPAADAWVRSGDEEEELTLAEATAPAGEPVNGRAAHDDDPAALNAPAPVQTEEPELGALAQRDDNSPVAPVAAGDPTPEVADARVEETDGSVPASARLEEPAPIPAPESDDPILVQAATLADAEEPAGPSAEASAGPHDDAAPAEPVAPVPAAAPMAAGWKPHLPGLLLGAVVGAVVASLAMALLVPRFMPSVDLRLVPVVDRVAKLEASVERTGRDVGQLNNEIALSIDNGTAMAAEVAAQTAGLADIHQRLDQEAARVAEEAVDPPVFAVAVGQLRAAFYAGRPFEAELINVYTMARDDKHFLDLLNQLSDPARTGLPNAAAMREEFQALAASAGLVVDGPQTYYGYAASLVGQYIGYASEPYAVEESNVAVADADRKLMNGDVAGAVKALGGLDRALAVPFEPWLNTARTYLRAESAIGEMTTAVTDSLRRRMGTADAG